MTNIAIFASGSGSNAENIFHYFNNNEAITINCIVTNNKDAGIINRAKRLEIPYFFISNKDFRNGKSICDLMKSRNIDFIVLAGFLALIPANLIKEYPNKIINIHPALLPNYGGKGMYGDNVHKAVIENQENESGITIHYVNEKYDEGKIILQAHCPVLKTDTYDKLAQRIHKLEHTYFPICIKQLLTN